VAGDGTKVILWDTPGFGDGPTNDRATARELRETFLNNKRRIHLVVLVRSFPYDGVGGQDEKKMLTMLKDCLGREIFKRFVVVFTRSNNLPTQDVEAESLHELNKKTADWIYNYLEELTGEKLPAPVRRFVRIENSKFCPVNCYGEKILVDTGKAWWPELISTLVGALPAAEAMRVSWLMANSRDNLLESSATSSTGSPATGTKSGSRIGTSGSGSGSSIQQPGNDSGDAAAAGPPARRVIKFIRLCLDNSKKLAFLMKKEAQQSGASGGTQSVRYSTNSTVENDQLKKVEAVADALAKIQLPPMQSGVRVARVALVAGALINRLKELKGE